MKQIIKKLDFTNDKQLATFNDVTYLISEELEEIMDVIMFKYEEQQDDDILDYYNLIHSLYSKIDKARKEYGNLFEKELQKDIKQMKQGVYFVDDLDYERGRILNTRFVRGETMTLTIDEARDWLLKNRVNQYGDLDLRGLDFSEFDGRVMICNMKVNNHLYQDNQIVKGNLHQNNQIVIGDLFQYRQSVERNLEQYRQIVNGTINQSQQEAGVMIFQHKQFAGHAVIQDEIANTNPKPYEIKVETVKEAD